MSVLAALLPLLPLLSGAHVALRGWNTVTAWTAPVAAAAVTVVGGALAVHVLDHGPVTALDSLVRAGKVRYLGASSMAA